MKLTKSLILLAGVSLFLSGCMMTPWGMGGMQGGNSMTPVDKEFEAVSIEDNYSLSLRAVFSGQNGNSKFFIRLEDAETGTVINNYDSYLNIYRAPYENSSIRRTLDNPLVEKLPFTDYNGMRKYVTYASLPQGDYLIRVVVPFVEGYQLSSALTFDYKINNVREMSEQMNMNSGGMFGVSNWVWGAAMGAVMILVMAFGVFH